MLTFRVTCRRITGKDFGQPKPLNERSGNERGTDVGGQVDPLVSTPFERNRELSKVLEEPEKKASPLFVGGAFVYALFITLPSCSISCRIQRTALMPPAVFMLLITAIL